MKLKRPIINKDKVHSFGLALLGFTAKNIEEAKPVIKTGFLASLGLISLLIGAIMKIAEKTANNPQKQKFHEVEKFFMPKFNNSRFDAKRKSVHEIFANEMRDARDIERARKRRFGRIDGAWKLASVGMGLLVGGITSDSINFIGAVGLGILAGALVGWIGAVINNYIAKNDANKIVAIVPKREEIKAPELEANKIPQGRSELIQKVLLEAATSLQKLDNNIARLRHPDSIAALSQLVKIGKKLMDLVAVSPEKLNAAQRVFTYYCPEAVNVSEALAKIENDAKPDIARIISTQNILQKLVILFEKTELELKEDDNKALDIDLKLLDQSLKSDLAN